MKTLRIILVLVLIALGFAAGVYWKTNNASVQEAEARNAVLIRNDNPDDEGTTILGGEDEATSLLPDELTPQELHNIRLFEQSAPSVCFITTTTLRRNYYNRNVEEIPTGSGSGFIWDNEGHIVTNFHVIQNSNSAKVTLSDGETYTAEVIGTAPEKDLAVLRIDAPRSVLIPLPRGGSEDLRVGQSVYAIGNPFGLDQTLTTGVVSALGREIKSVAGIPIKDVIQTDAAINPGNSGGPLLNSSGRLIGVNTAIYSPSGASAGIGFSIPVNVVKWVVPDLIQYGQVNRPMIGVELARPLRNIEGAVVLGVVENSPAAQAGIRAVTTDRYGNVELGDVIVAVNGEPIASNSDLYLALEQYKPGDEVTVTVRRAKQRIDIPIRLASTAQ